MRIRIIAETVFGEPDKDQSIEIPEEGELECKLDSTPDETPVVTKFTEHLCRRQHYPAVSFPAISLGNLYMIWVDERKEWVGIKYEFISRDPEGSAPGSGAIYQGYDENVLSSGPYALDKEHTRKILEAYGISEGTLTLEQVLHTKPSELEKIAPERKYHPPKASRFRSDVEYPNGGGPYERPDGH